MNFVSVCSGIEAASVAWHPLGWRPLLFAEIAKFPSAVLAHRFPEVQNVGDFTTIAARTDCDLLVGGTPCQAFSVAGLRGGLSDARGNLALEYVRLADRLRARWIVWENVPGVLSSGGGRDFGSILGALAELGYGFAYRVLDARFIGVPQRRRRVFLVGYLGDWRAAAAVLFERSSVRRDTPKGQQAGQEIAGTLGIGAGGRRLDLDSHGAYIATAEGGKEIFLTRSNIAKGVNNQTPLIACFDPTQITHPENRSAARPDTASLSKTARPPHVAFSVYPESGQGADLRATEIQVSPALIATATDRGTRIVDRARVRRLTPRECERLQGFPDDWTAILGAKDSPRYAALGNSMAVPVMRWIGRRLDFVDRLIHPKGADRVHLDRL